MNSDQEANEVIVMTYCVSDIHGDYDKYKRLLQEIEFSEDDLLIVLGDTLDRGAHFSAVLLDMMQHENIIHLVGNHDFVGAVCLNHLSKGITKAALETLEDSTLAVISAWLDDGGEATLKDFSRLSQEEKDEILDYLNEFELYREIYAGGKHYILTHAGLGDFSPQKRLDDYSLEELAFCRTDYSKALFQDKILVTGHTPTALIPENPKPGYIYRGNHHIAIDCGCGFGGRLGAICLDTGEEFYVE